MKDRDYIIEEGDFNINMRKIIQKNYFHETPLRKNKLEWLEAIRWGETKSLRKAQLNISTRNTKHQQFNTEIVFNSDYRNINSHSNDTKTVGSISSIFPKHMMLDEFCSIFSKQKNVILKKKNIKNESVKILSKNQKRNYFIDRENCSKPIYGKGTWYYLAWYWKPNNSLYYFKKEISTMTYEYGEINPKNTQLKLITSEEKKPFKSETYNSLKSNTAPSIYNGYRIYEKSGYCNYHNMSLTPMNINNSSFEQTGSLQISKTPYNLDSLNHIDTLDKFSKHYKHYSFVIKEPNRKEEAARRLADRVSISTRT